MRVAGKTYLQIGDALGITEDAARVCIKRRMDKLEAIGDEDAQELRRLECERIDAMLAGLWQAAESGDTAAVATVIKLQQRKAEMLGLDKKDANVGTGDMTVNLVLRVDDKPAMTTVTVENTTVTTSTEDVVPPREEDTE